ncbi:MAG: hypothetical protein ACUVUQ_07110 [Thermodesulfovibrionales bacterium]
MSKASEDFPEPDNLVMRQTEVNVFKVILSGTFDKKFPLGHLNILTLYKKLDGG